MIARTFASISIAAIGVAVVSLPRGAAQAQAPSQPFGTTSQSTATTARGSDLKSSASAPSRKSRYWRNRGETIHTMAAGVFDPLKDFYR